MNAVDVLAELDRRIEIGKLFGQEYAIPEADLVGDAALREARDAVAELINVLKETAGILRAIRSDHKDYWSNECTNMVSAWLLASNKALARVQGGQP